MASRTGTTAGPSGNISTGQRDQARAYFSSGTVIEAYHLNYLRDMINSVCGHAHGLNDYSKIHEYGNTDSTDSTYESTEGAGVGTGNTVYAGNLIYAYDHNVLANSTNSIQTHSHSWTDN